jgi:5-formyltetrahydrofolate cyclo-ligase
MSDPRRTLRRELSERRRALDTRARLAAADAVFEHLKALPEFLVDEVVAGYWAVNGELPLHRVAAECARRGQHWHLPVLADTTLRFAPMAAGTPVLPNRYGIPEPDVAADRLREPAAIQLVLVPLVGFDRRGNRLGSGAGWYDKSFAFLRAGERPREPVLVGVAYAFQEVSALPAEDWDVPLDFVVTERELIDCRAPEPSE